MNIYINRRSAVPVYRQISEGFIDRISSGQLHEGQKLPSVRSLADSLSVSLVTVQKAYQILAKRGYIASEKGRGNYVRVCEHMKTENDQYGGANQQIWQMDIPDYIPRAHVLRYMNVDRNEIDYNFSVAECHPKVLPVDWIRERAKYAIDRNPEALVTYSSSIGDPVLRQAAKEYLSGLGLETDEQAILVINGTQQGIELVAKTFLNYGDTVVIESPAYIGSIDIFKARGVQIIPVPVDEYGLNTNKLISICERYKPKLLYTNPTFQNPTGTTLSLQRRQELVDIAESFQMIVFEDDTWSELYFRHLPPPPIKSFDRTGNIIYVKSFSKTLATGCRIAVMVADRPLLNRLIAAKSISDLGSPLITQKIVAELLLSGESKDKMKEIRKKLEHRSIIAKEVLLKACLDHTSQSLIWHEPYGGMFYWLRLPEYLHDEALLQTAMQQRLSFLPGNACFATDEHQGFIRISYSNQSEEDLKLGLQLLCQVISAEYEKKKHGSYFPII